MASPDHIQQKLRDVVEATQHTHFRSAVKGPGRPTFRSKVVRDLSTILELNRSVLTWSCNPPPLTVGGRNHAPDLRSRRGCGTTPLRRPTRKLQAVPKPRRQPIPDGSRPTLVAVPVCLCGAKIEVCPVASELPVQAPENAMLLDWEI